MSQAECQEVRCRGCPWQQSVTSAGMVQWLRKAGKLRGDRSVEPDILRELFRALVPQTACPQCGSIALSLTQSPEEQWNDERLCEGCRRPIPRVRMEALPGVRLCAACQDAEEAGQKPETTDYCPRCGAPMEVRLARGSGVARYVLTCTGRPPCRLRTQ